MKAKLIFNLPEDLRKFELANNAAKMYNVLCKLDKWLRSNTKYAPDTMSKDTYNAFQQCRDQLRELMNDENINFDL
jgi:HEAT repeat protein